MRLRDLPEHGHRLGAAATRSLPEGQVPTNQQASQGHADKGPAQADPASVCSRLSLGNPRCLPEAPLRRPPAFPGARGLPHPPASLLTHRWGSGFFPDGLWEKSGLLCREKPKICSQQLAQRKLCFSTGPESWPAVGGGRSSTTSPPSGRGPCQTGILTYGGREMHHRCSLGGEGAETEPKGHGQAAGTGSLLRWPT